MKWVYSKHWVNKIFNVNYCTPFDYDWKVSCSKILVYFNYIYIIKIIYSYYFDLLILRSMEFVYECLTEAKESKDDGRVVYNKYCWISSYVISCTVFETLLCSHQSNLIMNQWKL